jgi:type II secretory pathway pseudopilin PulG
MIRQRMRASLRDDEGFAMIFVIAIGMVVAILMAAIMANVLQNQSTTRIHRNITSAQGAAEASLDDAVYQLGLVGANGQPNWTNFVTGPNAWTQANPHPLDFGSSNDASASAWIAPQPNGNYVLYATGKYGTNTRTIRATLQQGAPPAFDFSMFASKGIDIHQHGGWLSPQVWTTGVHSNGYINIDYPSEFNVNSMEAVGNLMIQKGGGKIPSGNVPAGGYNWLDPLNHLCYPGGYQYPGGAPPQGGACSSTNMYPGTATIKGSVYAGSLTLGSQGAIKAVSPAFTLDTGQLLDGGLINGKVKTGSSNVTTCASGCAQVQNGITVQSGYAPPVVPFPSIDFSYWYRSKAQQEVDNTVPTTHNHYFTSPSSFLSWATGGTATQNNYYNADANGNLTKWTAASNHYPDVILLQGTFDITGGSLNLNFGSIQSTVQSVTHMTGGAPIILIQGILCVENGGITLNSGLVSIGSDEDYNGIVMPYNATTKTPAWINTSNTTGLLKPANLPGIIAAGGQISSSDYVDVQTVEGRAGLRPRSRLFGVMERHDEDQHAPEPALAQLRSEEPDEGVRRSSRG